MHSDLHDLNSEHKNQLKQMYNLSLRTFGLKSPTLNPACCVEGDTNSQLCKRDKIQLLLKNFSFAWMAHATLQECVRHLANITELRVGPSGQRHDFSVYGLLCYNHPFIWDWSGLMGGFVVTVINKQNQNGAISNFGCMVC